MKLENNRVLRTNYILLASLLFSGLIMSRSSAADTTELAFSLLQNRPAIYIRVNQSKPFLVILDTGLGRGLMLDNQKARAIGLQPLQTDVVDNLGMGQLKLQRYAKSTLSIGSMQLPITNINGDERTPQLMAMMGKDKYGNSPVGVLSVWEFRDRQISFDLAEKALSLSTTQRLNAGEENVVPIIDTGRIPEFAIKIDGQPFNAHLDSGSSASLILPSNMLDKFSYQQPPKKQGKALTAGMEHSLWTAQLKGDVEIGSVRAQNPNILFINKLPRVNIGFSFFNKGKITIDGVNHLAKFEYRG